MLSQLAGAARGVSVYAVRRQLDEISEPEVLAGNDDLCQEVDHVRLAQVVRVQRQAARVAEANDDFHDRERQGDGEHVAPAGILALILDRRFGKSAAGAFALRKRIRRRVAFGKGLFQNSVAFVFRMLIRDNLYQGRRGRRHLKAAAAGTFVESDVKVEQLAKFGGRGAEYHFVGRKLPFLINRKWNGLFLSSNLSANENELLNSVFFTKFSNKPKLRMCLNAN